MKYAIERPLMASDRVCQPVARGGEEVLVLHPNRFAAVLPCAIPASRQAGSSADR